jgi:SAM-dependent methyltransferase
LATLTQGSFSPGASYEEWEAKRRFIAATIDRDGSILDIGCANGFFLRCLQEWSGHTLVPYGIDVESNLIAQAAALFPQHADHFSVLDVKDISGRGQHGLPARYDFVFWNFLGAWNINSPEWQTILRQVLSLAKKRVIIGFYGTNQYAPYSKEWYSERDRLLDLPLAFEKAGFVLSGSQLNPTNYNQVIVWSDLQ